MRLDLKCGLWRFGISHEDVLCDLILSVVFHILATCSVYATQLAVIGHHLLLTVMKDRCTYLSFSSSHRCRLRSGQLVRRSCQCTLLSYVVPDHSFNSICYMRVPFIMYHGHCVNFSATCWNFFFFSVRRFVGRDEPTFCALYATEVKTILKNLHARSIFASLQLQLPGYQMRGVSRNFFQSGD